MNVAGCISRARVVGPDDGPPECSIFQADSRVGRAARAAPEVLGSRSDDAGDFAGSFFEGTLGDAGAAGGRGVAGGNHPPDPSRRRAAAGHAQRLVPSPCRRRGIGAFPARYVVRTGLHQSGLDHRRRSRRARRRSDLARHQAADEDRQLRHRPQQRSRQSRDPPAPTAWRGARRPPRSTSRRRGDDRVGRRGPGARVHAGRRGIATGRHARHRERRARGRGGGAGAGGARCCSSTRSTA